MSDRSLREGARRGRGESMVERLAHYKREERAGRAVPFKVVFALAPFGIEAVDRILYWICNADRAHSAYLALRPLFKALDEYEEPIPEIKEAIGASTLREVGTDMGLDATVLFWAVDGTLTFASGRHVPRANLVMADMARVLQVLGMPVVRAMQDIDVVVQDMPPMSSTPFHSFVRIAAGAYEQHEDPAGVVFDVLREHARAWWNEDYAAAAGAVTTYDPLRDNPPYSPEVLQHMREELEATGHPEHVIRTVLRGAVTPPRSFPRDPAGADRRAELDRQAGVARRMRNRDGGMLANPRRCYCRWCLP